MISPSPAKLNALWKSHHEEWRDPLQVLSGWEQAGDVDRNLLRFQVVGNWWQVLEQANITLIITREYEHLVIAMCVEAGQPSLSYLRVPHPSGLAFDQGKNTLYLACTRNPNQVMELRPVIGLMPRLDVKSIEIDYRPLIPACIRFFPGSLYMHDLAVINGALYANSVGQNAIVRLDENGEHERVWWPRAVEREGVPVTGQNYIQLNSIAAGSTLENSYFSASSDKLSARRPGHHNFPVDKRGVIFSGKTREVVARGLTRPHSARLFEENVWVDNSGYGELGYIQNGDFTQVTKLSGWTRGLTFHRHIAFVGTSRVIPRFRQYAPGLDVNESRCGIHAVDTQTGQTLGSLYWPYGNQIFAIEALPATITHGFPFVLGSKRARKRERQIFYSFEFND